MQVVSQEWPDQSSELPLFQKNCWPVGRVDEEGNKVLKKFSNPSFLDIAKEVEKVHHEMVESGVLAKERNFVGHFEVKDDVITICLTEKNDPTLDYFERGGAVIMHS